MRIVFVSMLLLLSTQSFGRKKKQVPDFIKKEFTNCYQPGRDASQGLFDIGLYYELALHHWSYGYGSAFVTCDTNINYYLFYKDGTVLYNIISEIEEPSEYHQCYGKPSRILTSLQIAYQHPELPIYHFYTGTWGLYSVQHDTIVIHWIHSNAHGSWNDEWFAGEMRYRIMNKETIEFIPNAGKIILNKSHKPAKIKPPKGPYNSDGTWSWSKLFQKKKDLPIKKKVENSERVFPAKFIPYDSIPASDCWLTREDWLLCK